MSKLIGFIGRFRKDEDGAALVEYSILIGLITAAVIVTVVAVGGWVETAWSVLNTSLQANIPS